MALCAAEHGGERLEEVFDLLLRIKKMSNWKYKRKRWLDNKSRKIQKNKKGKHKKKHYSRPNVINKRIISENRIMLIPPVNFSLLENPEETMDFFRNFAKEIEKPRRGIFFYVDSSNVKHVTVDALIYLIAILENDVINRNKNYSFAGNYPIDREANAVYQESGFNNYVKSRTRELPKATNRMKIVGGMKNDSEIARSICDFVISNLGKKRQEIMSLQTILIELMSNVYHHAYDKNAFMRKKWYLYAEYTNGYIQCIFVDTGFGIAKTVRKNFMEWVGNTLGVYTKDAILIESAFNGDFRTATKEPNRGNGLNSVKKKVIEGPFASFDVLSGKGRVSISKLEESCSISGINYDNALYGTLYAFVIK